MFKSSIVTPRFRCACVPHRASGGNRLRSALLERLLPLALFALLSLACQKARPPEERLASTNDDLIALPNAMAVRIHGAQLEAVAPDGALRWKLDLKADEVVIGRLCPAANSLRSSCGPIEPCAPRQSRVAGRGRWSCR